MDLGDRSWRKMMPISKIAARLDRVLGGKWRGGRGEADGVVARPTTVHCTRNDTAPRFSGLRIIPMVIEYSDVNMEIFQSIQKHLQTSAVISSKKSKYRYRVSTDRSKH
uniref:Uncharacterized protein n=1 Tax=Oryza rufipogon TaxID=4529 RepID=A0A0E0Q3X5_ORYRU